MPLSFPLHRFCWNGLGDQVNLDHLKEKKKTILILNFRIQKALLVLLILAQVSFVCAILQKQCKSSGRHVARKFPWPRNGDALCSKGSRRPDFNALAVSHLRILLVLWSQIFFAKGATSCVWLHELEHGHCQRQLQPLFETEHLWLRTLLHGSLRSLLHCRHWWTQLLCLSNCWKCRHSTSVNHWHLFDFPRYRCWSQPFWWSKGSLLLNSKGEYLAPPASSQPYIPLFREHCWPLLAPMSPTCTSVSRWAGKSIGFFRSCS